MATLDERAREGDEARQVLENPAFARAFNSIEEEYTEAWKNSPVRDRDGRETLWTTLKLLHKLRGTLEASMMDGKLARVELEHQEQILAQERRQGLDVDGMS